MLRLTTQIENASIKSVNTAKWCLWKMITRLCYPYVRVHLAKAVIDKERIPVARLPYIKLPSFDTRLYVYVLEFW